MKKILGFAAAVAALAVIGATDASALCGSNILFGQGLPACGGGYCYVVTPDGAQPSGGSFWSLGTGNAATGAGNDNGDWTPNGATGWCRAGGPGCYLVGGWADGNGPGVDGCIDGLITGGGKENMIVQVSTESGGQGYYAAASASRNNAFAEFEFSVSNANITLQPIPKPSITGTTRSAPNVQIDVVYPNVLGAFTTDGVITAAQVIKQYRVYKQVVPRASAAPASRNRSTGWVAAGAATNLGSPFSYSETDCATDKDIYLAASVVYDSGYESAVVSENSTRVQCGPTLAEPNPRFKLIDKKPSKGLSPRQ